LAYTPEVITYHWGPRLLFRRQDITIPWLILKDMNGQQENAAGHIKQDFENLMA
jgi:hypothetical protein